MTSDEIYHYLKSRIQSGQIKQGPHCPSENELHKRFGAARGTIRTAMRRLTREGFLMPPRQGQVRIVQKPQPLELPKFSPSGSKRVKSTGETLKQLGKQEGWVPSDTPLAGPDLVALGRIRHEPRLNPDHIAAALKLKVEDEVIWFKRVRSAREMPILIQWAVVPSKFIEQLDVDDLVPGGITKRYRETYGIERAAARAGYAATHADRNEARYLMVEKDSPCIEERRVSYYWPKSAKVRKPSNWIPYEFLVALYTDRVSLEFNWQDTAGT